MPAWLRTGKVALHSRWSALREWFARIPIGLRFVLLLLLTILLLQIPYLWFSHRQTTQIVEMQYRITLLHQLKSAQMTLKQEMQRFQRHAEDYSIWEEAVRAIQRKDTEWLATNIWDWGVAHLGYESAGVWNADGVLLGYAGIPPEKFFATTRRLYEKARQGIGDVGIVPLEGRFYLVACTPVRDEELSETVHGVMCFVNEIDSSLQRTLWNGNAEVGSLPLSESERSAGAVVLHYEGQLGYPVSISLPIRDPEGRPIAQLVASVSPSQSFAARQSLQYAQYGAWVLSATIALGASLMMVFLLRRHLRPFLYVASRLARGDWTARVHYPARDEFGYLAQAFNQMAQNLHQSFQHQERQRREITARTAELEALHQHLQSLNQELRQKNEQLERAAQTDGLTGLLNHAAFQSALRTEVERAERLRQPLSLIMLDVDHFKQFNDTYGHPAGDEVLRQVAEVLRRHARPYDTVARYGGEEFAVILPGTPLEPAISVAERLRQAVEQIANCHASITASIGVAEYQPGTMPATLLYNADSALYIAKRSGRNQVQAYQPHAA